MALLLKSQIKQIIVNGLEQIAPIQNDVGVDAIAEAIFQAQNAADSEIPNNIVETFNTRTGNVLPESGDYNTDQVDEGTSNLYWKEAPQDSKHYVRFDSSWVESSASNTVFSDSTLPPEIQDLGFNSVQDVLEYLLNLSINTLELNP